MRVLVGIPTLNENLNINKIYNKVRKINKNWIILFIDDNSTDGTIKKIRNLKNKDKNVILNIRKKRMGIGSAHKEIISYAFKNCYDYLITMDADGSHDPKYIPKMFLNLKKSSLVITNRFFYKDSLKTWPFIRLLITHTRHFLINFLLAIDLDTSGAFRLYDIKKIKLRNILKAKHNGYSFFWESIFIMLRYNYKIVQIPIKMKKRTYGSSKISINEIISAITYLIYFFWKKISKSKI